MVKHWSEAVLENMREAHQIPIKHLKIPNGEGDVLEHVEAKALSGNEYFVLRSHQKIKEQKDEEGKIQMLALLVTHRRLWKADENLKEKDFFDLPLHIQLKLTKALDDYFGVSDLARPSPLEKNL